MLYPKITKTAKALPKKRVTNHDLAQFLETSDEWITQRTGIKERRISVTESVASLSVEVAKKLSQDIDVTTIDLIIVATMSADYSTPSVACVVQESVGAVNAMCFDVNVACSGFVYALSIAEKYLSHPSYQTALVIGTDVMSHLVDWRDRQTAVLFGDGSGGVLIEKTSSQPSFLAESIHSDGKRHQALFGHVIARDNRFRQIDDTYPFLVMNGKQIFDFAMRDVSKNMLELLLSHSVATEEIDYVLAHQANFRILEALAKKTKISSDKFLSNVDRFGNTSAASIPLLLDDAVKTGVIPLSGESLCMLTGYGAGLTWGSLLIKL
ncbi:3-oxoacyl-ACP synthase [Vagococcus martis]|uniref:Beta-ketoacyl-[acyl-carrier-protein] synthase III n=1 Tax=Vagococcus martis TaxID=1768210 RepID=A0A1V4DEH7_9ENTE|nr:beta-ketoacyl-ACP synthase III [Vagococcus martis]OPF86821.1 3-oxoacyl-ACP synthase [Vagococcus martis]